MTKTKRKPRAKAASSGPSGKWRDLLRLIPGYDPFADPGDSWFDGGAAQRAIDFFPECLRHVEGALAGQPFKLEPWQQAIVANLFGWKRTDAQGREVRRYREAFVYVPRKNGKTPLAAGVGLYVFFCDDERGQQNYIAAAERDQAGLLFRHARGMVDLEPELAARCRAYGGNAAAGQSRSLVRDDGSFLKILSADADTKHGGNSHLVLIDELHAQTDRDLVDVLSTSMASLNRKSPLFISVTTADFLRDSVCNEKYEYACKVRDGLVIDRAFLPVIYEAKNDDDWKSPAVWAKANPNLGVSVSREYLERECARAQEIPAYENTFKRLHLNLRTEQDVRWLPMDVWDACAGEVNADALAGRDCFAGLDLANTNDLASLALVFPPKEEAEPWQAIVHFWAHAEACAKRERSNKTRLGEWVRRGFITETGGNSIDYSAIQATAKEAAARFRVVKLAYDPWNAEETAQKLMADGIEVVKFPPSLNNFNEASKKLEELLTARAFAHGGNPVLRWMASNAAIHTDGRGYKMPSRKKSTEKIDGIMALLMALAVAIADPAEGPSVYESRGIELIGPAAPAAAAPEPVAAGAPAEPVQWGGAWPEDDD